MPCVDSPTALCRWKLQFNLPSPLIAVSCGEQLVPETEPEFGSDQIHSFHLKFSVPACLIGFAIGAFESVVDKHMNEIQHFSPPGISSLLETTTSCLQSVMDFFEETLACQYPFPSYRQVFVHAPPRTVLPFASMSIISSSVLAPNESIEGQLHTRRVHAEAVAKQYFGCVVIGEPAPSSLTYKLSPSWWLVPSLARYTASVVLRRCFGNNEDKYWVIQENNALAEFEISRLNGSPLRLDVESNAFLAEAFSDMAVRKGALVLRLVELKITVEQFLHVLSVLLGKAGKRETSLINRSDFVNNVKIISGTQVKITS